MLIRRRVLFIHRYPLSRLPDNLALWWSSMSDPTVFPVDRHQAINRTGSNRPCSYR